MNQHVYDDDDVDDDDDDDDDGAIDDDDDDDYDDDDNDETERAGATMGRNLFYSGEMQNLPPKFVTKICHLLYNHQVHGGQLYPNQHR